MKKAVPLHPQTGNDPGAKKEIIGTIKRETIKYRTGIKTKSLYKKRKYESRQFKPS